MDAYNHMGIDEVLLQHFIDKKDEIPIEGISIDGGCEVKLLVKKHSMRFAKNGFGIYSELLPFDDILLEQKVTSFMRKAHYTGIFEIELIVDKLGKVFFLEVNFRNTMFNHACADYGVNILWLYAEWTLNQKIDICSLMPRNKSHRVMYEFEDFNNSVIHGSTSFWQWLNDFRLADSYLYIDKRDMRPVWHLLYRKVNNCIRMFWRFYK